MEFRQSPLEVGKDRKRSEIIKMVRLASGKRQLHSVSGRHYDDRKRNATNVFQKVSEGFYNFGSLSNDHGACQTKCNGVFNS